MKKLGITVTAALLCLGVLASCGNKSSKGGLDEYGRYSSITAATNIAIDTLTPTNGNSNPKTSFYYNLYESLFDINEDEELCPDLGKEITIVDETHWEISIFHTIKDADGNAVTASDVAYSINWLKSSGNAVNYGCFKSITAKDDYTVVFEWNQAPESLADIEFPLCRTFIFSEKAWNDHKFASDPCTTGNYQVKKFVSSSSLTLEYNKNYWADNSTEEGLDKRLALHHATVNEITFTYVSDATTASLNLGLGYIDYCDYIKSTDLKDYENNSDYVVDTEVSSTYSWLGFNMDAVSPFYNNKDLRLAVCYALDSDAIAAVQPGNYAAMKSYGTSYFSDFNTDWEKETNYSSTVDTAKAKELVKSSGYNNEKITIMCKSSEEDTNAVEKMLAQLTDIGLNVEMQSCDSTTFQTDTADPKNWDIVLFSGMGGSNLVGSWQLALSNVGSTGSDGTANGTLCFNRDETLYTKYATAQASATKSDATVKDVIDYVYDNAYIYPLTYAITAKVYKADKISDVYYREGYATLCASTYKGQEVNKDAEYEGWTLPTGTYDAALAGTYTFVDEAQDEGKQDGTYSLTLKDDGTYRLDCVNCYKEEVFMTGTWTVKGDVVTLDAEKVDGVYVQGKMDRLLNSGWVDSSTPTPIKLTLSGTTFTPVDYTADAGETGDDTEETDEVPMFVQHFVTAASEGGEGYSTYFAWNGDKLGTWYVVIKDGEQAADGTETGDAVMFVKVDGAEYAYRGLTFTKSGPNITVSAPAFGTDSADAKAGLCWEDDGTSKWVISGANACAPETIPTTAPGIVTALSGNGFDCFEWDGGDYGYWYLLTKDDEAVEGESGEAHLVVTGLSENEAVYHGSFVHEGADFTFTLGATDDPILGYIWNADSKTVVWSFSADAMGFVPANQPSKPFPVTYMTTNESYDCFEYHVGNTNVTYYCLTKQTGTDASGNETGDAKIFVTGLGTTDGEYSGTFVHNGPTFTITLTEAPTMGDIWEADGVTSIWSFSADAKGFVPSPTTAA